MSDQWGVPGRFNLSMKSDAPPHPTTGRYRHFIRISCGYPWSEAVENGIRTLAAIINQMR